MTFEEFEQLCQRRRAGAACPATSSIRCRWSGTTDEQTAHLQVTATIRLRRYLGPRTARTENRSGSAAAKA
jgi:hypothetical protein